MFQIGSQGPAGADGSPFISAFFGGGNPAVPFTPPTTGNVDEISGEFAKTYTDVSIPGPGPHLDLTRTYSYGATGASGVGMFGHGWTSSYGMTISEALPTSSMEITQENGSPLVFQDSNGTYSPPSWATSSSLVDDSQTGIWTFTRQGLEVFEFEGTQLQSISDLGGDKTSLGYNSSNQLATVTDSTGRTLTFAYNPSGLVSSVTDPMGRVTSYSYNADDDLTSVTQPGGQVTSYGYDSSNALVSITDPNGAVTELTYDPNHRVLSESDPMGLTTTFSYSQSPGQAGSTTVTDPHGSVTQLSYTFVDGVFEAPTSITTAYGTEQAATTTYADSPTSGLPTSITDPDGHTTSYTYGSDNDLVTSTDGLGKTTTYTYNSRDQATSATDPMGIMGIISYDDNGDVLTHGEMAAGSLDGWAVTTPPNDDRWTNGVSCAGDFCMELDYNSSDQIVVDVVNGSGAWSWPATAIPITYSEFNEQLSCGSTFCVAASPDGHAAISYDPTAPDPTWAASAIPT
ncbi:MAG: DUF6531 domain-containing protein, partial [Acidimicrobiales bacterium]